MQTETHSHIPGRSPARRPIGVRRLAHAVARGLTGGLIIFACATASTTNLPAVLARLDASVPVQISTRTAVASVGFHRDGRLVVSLAPAVAVSTDADMLAFLYLHELGHVRLGHLRPRDPQQMRFSIPGMFKGQAWQMEYDADAWAAREMRAHGYDPVQGISAVFLAFGDGGGITHPPDYARILRVRRLIEIVP